MAAILITILITITNNMSAQSKTANKSAIDLDITTNGSGDITGADLNSILDNIVDSYEDFIGSYTTAQIAALESPTTRQLVYDTTLGEYFYYNGSAWKNICCGGVLNVDTSAAATTAVTTEETLYTYSLPASTLNVNGKAIQVHAWGEFAANNNIKTVKFKFGSSTVQFDTSGADGNSKYWELEIMIFRTGATTQNIVGRFAGLPRAGAFVDAIGLGAKASGSETLSGAVTISITGTNGTASANDIIVNNVITKRVF